MCITAGPATLSSTIVFANRATINGRLVHILGYQNEAADHTGKPNAMILPIPSAAAMGPDNMIDTRPFAAFLRGYAKALQPMSRGMWLSATRGAPKSFVPHVFERGSYTVVLAASADVADIQEAINSLPPAKRPQIADELLAAFATLYPGWHLAICCWAGDIKPEPLLWWFEPAFADLFMPGLDAHDGGAPNLAERVWTDHTLVVGHANDAPRGAVRVLVPYVAPAGLLPELISGDTSSSQVCNGDWWADDSGRIRREQPSGSRRVGTLCVRHPDGSVAIATRPEQATNVQRIVDARHRFNVEYCTSKGWPTNTNELTIAQIMEIREQDGWKNAGQQ